MIAKNTTSASQNVAPFWLFIGKLLYAITWPGIWLVVKCTPPRTRVVIVYDAKVLMVRDWLGTGLWGLPGGGLHRGEDARIGAVRETLEETGVKLRSEDLRPLADFRMRSSGMMINYRAFYVLLDRKPTVVVDGKEIIDYRWVPFDTAGAQNASNSARHIIGLARQVIDEK